MTVATTTSATSGSYTIVVTGVGSATHSTSVGLTVTAAKLGHPEPRSVRGRDRDGRLDDTGRFAAFSYEGGRSPGAVGEPVHGRDESPHLHHRFGRQQLGQGERVEYREPLTAHVSAAASMVIEVDEFSGVATTNALDRSVGASATGTAASSSSLTPASPGELLVGFSAGPVSSPSGPPERVWSERPAFRGDSGLPASMQLLPVRARSSVMQVRMQTTISPEDRSGRRDTVGVGSARPPHSRCADTTRLST
jgi:hypothetical protein